MRKEPTTPMKDRRWQRDGSARRRFLESLAVGVLVAAAFGAVDVSAQARSERDSVAMPGATSHAAADTMDDETVYRMVDTGFRKLRPVFERACYDCHSTRTRYPWYYKLPLVNGLIERDIREARSHVDMSRGFPFIGSNDPAEDLVKIRSQLQKGAMPPLKYRMLHWDAQPSPEEIDSILVWIDLSLDLLDKRAQSPRGKRSP